MMHRSTPIGAGGSGYVLNQAALEMWGRRGADAFRVHQHDSREDVFMGIFFAWDTQDDEGGWRFGSSAEATSRFSGRNSPIAPLRLQSVFNFSNKIGIHHVSKHQISFHLKDCKKRLAAMRLTTTDLIFRYHAFFNEWCPNDDKGLESNAGI
jgi:hypothetical protein